jgi:hypothetical protein
MPLRERGDVMSMERGLRGLQGEPGLKGETGETGKTGSACISLVLSHKEFYFIKSVFWVAISIFLIALGVSIFISTYPFKTVIVKEPIPILNKDHRIPVGGVAELEVTWQKFTDSPAIVRLTLHRRDRLKDETVVVSSATWVSSRAHGQGKHIRLFPIREPLAVGKECWLVLSVNYDLYGLRPIIKEFKSEIFEVYQP